jgi:hypothetical protein
MNTVVRSWLLPGLLLLPGAVAAEPPKTVHDLAPHASGVALVEVVAMTEYDMRPADGNKGVVFKLRLVRGSGEFRDTVYVVTEFGGLRPPDGPEPKSGPLKADSLRKGQRYWLAFISPYRHEYPQGVLAFWSEKDPAAETLEAAVKADVFRWQPQYDPKTGLTYGHVVGKEKWSVRVEKEGKVLWAKELPGTKVEGYFGLGLWESTGNTFPARLPPCGKILVAPTKTRLEDGNEFGLAAGTYHVNTGFDPETGMRYAAWVSLPQTSQVDLLHREYDPATGKAKREDRFDSLRSGGKAVGAKTEEWYRKISRTFDPATGKVTQEEVFRYDQAAEPDRRWVKVMP